MKRLTSFFVLITFSFSSFANMCDVNFRPGVDPLYKEDFALASKINFYEGSVALVKRLRRRRTYLEVNEVKQTYKRWFTNFKEIESHIFKETTDLAVYRLRRPYRNINSSSKSVSQYDRVLEFVRTHDLKLSNSILDDLKISKTIKEDVLNASLKKEPKELLDYLYKKQRREYRRLGAYFDEYKYYESALNDLALSPECKITCKESLLKLRGELSISKSIYEIESIFKSSPHAIVVARRKEFLNESFGFVRNIISKIDFTKSIFEALKLKGIFERSSLVKLFKTAYDRKARNLHRSMIDKISLASLTKKQRADLLKRELKTYTDESLVVNFARVEDYHSKKAWNEIKDYASKSKDLEFYNLIKDSELIAKRLGRIGAFSLTTVVKRAAIIAGSAAVVVYLLGSSESDIQDNDRAVEPQQNLEDEIEVDSEGFESIDINFGSKKESSLYNFMKKITDEIDRVLK